MSELATRDPTAEAMGRFRMPAANGANNRLRVSNARLDDHASDFSRRIQADLAKLPPECRERPRWRLNGISDDARAVGESRDEAGQVAFEPTAPDLKEVCEDLACLTRCWADLTPARRKQVLTMVRAWARTEGDPISE